MILKNVEYDIDNEQVGYKMIHINAFIFDECRELHFYKSFTLSMVVEHLRCRNFHLVKFVSHV